MNKIDFEKSGQVYIWSSGWFQDNWTSLDVSMEITGCDEVSINFYLPIKEGEKEKRVAVFDGENHKVVTIERGKVKRFGPVFAANGLIRLRMISEYSEIGAPSDVRKLGVIAEIDILENDKLSVHRHVGIIPEAKMIKHRHASIAAMEFDEAFYVNQFELKDAPVDPLMHFLLLGWVLGYNPNKDFSVNGCIEGNEYLEVTEENPLIKSILQRDSYLRVQQGYEYNDVSEPDSIVYEEIWKKFIPPELFHKRKSFRFDPIFYIDVYSDLSDISMSPETHFIQHGKNEGRSPNRFQLQGKKIPGINAKLKAVCTVPEVVSGIERGDELAIELAFELILLGHPYDMATSDFSSKLYLHTYRDIREAQISPFLHYLTDGINEGRSSLSTLRARAKRGKRAFNPNLPTCLICSHELSNTGAPVVSGRLAAAACESHNVIAMSLRGGKLEERLADYSVLSIITENPFEEIEYFDYPELKEIDFAILNSVETFPFIKFLVSRELPFISYIHEYLDYTWPRYKAKFITWFSDAVVFSSEAVRQSWKGLFSDVDFNESRDSRIVPQEQLIEAGVPKQDFQNSRELLSQVLGFDCSDRRIVYGAGQIQIRKGTDIFVMAAQHAASIDPKAIFIWIGDGHSHEDMSYGVWLDKHMREAGANLPGANLFFIPAGEIYVDLCKAADSMFMSSRIDPLPNVVFDATKYGATVVMFKGASGFDDSVYTGRGLIKKVPYGRIDLACQELLNSPRKELRKTGLISTSIKANKKSYKPDVSLGAFFLLKGVLDTQLQERVDSFSMSHSYSASLLFSSDDSESSYREREWAKISKYGRLGMWGEAEHARSVITNRGEWAHRGSRIIPLLSQPIDADVPEFCIHNHAHYVDSLDEELGSVGAYHKAKKIVFTTDTEKKASIISAVAAAHGLSAEIHLLPNQGRDILPFLRVIQREKSNDDDIWCHIHQKKSITSATGGDAWRTFLIRTLLGGSEYISSAVLEAAKPGTGLVTAFDPFVVGWEDNRRFLPIFNEKFSTSLPEHPLLFPVGNMFFVRARVVKAMNSLFGEHYPWPNEPIANDGTVYHFIERLWPAVVASAGLSSVFIDNPYEVRL